MRRGQAIEQLAKEIRSCTLCPALCATRTQAVPGAGVLSADVLFIGEAPGRLGADQTGVPFTKDRSGALLRSVIDQLSRHYGKPLTVYITNVVKCNPQTDGGANRKPRPSEVRNCSTFLQREIALVRPKVIVTLGALAAAEVLGKVDHEWWVLVEGPIPIFVAKHPAYVVRGGGRERLTPAKYLRKLLPVLKWIHPPLPQSIGQV